MKKTRDLGNAEWCVYVCLWSQLKADVFGCLVCLYVVCVTCSCKCV